MAGTGSSLVPDSAFHKPPGVVPLGRLTGLLRQYFPKGTDLSGHSADEIAAVAAILNTRPRKTLKWKTPAEALDEAAIEGIIIVTRASTSRSRFFARIGDRAGGSRVAPSSAALSRLARAPHATRAREES